MKEDYSWIKLFRKITEWEWYGDVYVFKLFVHLLIDANHETKKVNGITIERGSTLTSVAALSLGAKISINSVKHSLKKLVDSGEITEEIKPKKYRIITIKNYEKYQSVSSVKTNSKTNKRTNKRTNSKTNKRTINNKDNISTDILSEKKKCVCPTGTHTHKEEAASAPHALGERAAAVTYGEIRQFQIDHHIGGGEMVSEFYNGFEKSGTKIPDNWQDLYIRYARAEWKAQNEFIEKLEKGEYIEKWGHADAGT